MFLFSLSMDIGKTVSEIENTMDVPELMEYLAYYQTRDEKRKAELISIINAEKADSERGDEIMAFFQAVARKKGTKK